MVEKDEKYIPIVRWVGSKKRILNKILENVPEEFEDYYEPFVGGGIVFLYMPYENKVILNDSNKDLMNLYERIKNDSKELIKKVDKYEKNYLAHKESDRKEAYLDIRDKFNKLKGKYTLDRASHI